MLGIVFVLGFLVLAASQLRTMRHEGVATWPAIAAIVLMVVGIVTAIGGGLAAESTTGEQDWLAVGLMLALLAVVTLVYGAVTVSRHRRGGGTGSPN